MASRRQRKVAELLHEEISQIIQHQIQDPRIGFVTVTDVEISPDLRLAQVYVTVLGDDTETKSALEGLTSATGFFRRILGQSLSLRHVPDLTFKIDTSLERGMRIEQLLDSLDDIDSDSENSSEMGPDADAG